MKSIVGELQIVEIKTKIDKGEHFWIRWKQLRVYIVKGKALY